MSAKLEIAYDANNDKYINLIHYVSNVGGLIFYTSGEGG